MGAVWEAARGPRRVQLQGQPLVLNWPDHSGQMAWPLRTWGQLGPVSLPREPALPPSCQAPLSLHSACVIVSVQFNLLEVSMACPDWRPHQSTKSYSVR